MFEAALAYPKAGAGAPKRIALGGVLVLFSFLVVPLILLHGYYLRVLGSSFGGEPTPPSFEDWRTLFTDGVKAIAVIFAYTLLPSTCLFLAVLVGGDGGGGFAVLGTGILIVSLLLYAGVSYVAPIGLVALARTGSMGASLDRAEIATVARSGTYLRGWLLAALVFVVGSVIAAMASVLLLGVFVFFYASVASSYLVGRGVANAQPGE